MIKPLKLVGVVVKEVVKSDMAVVSSVTVVIVLNGGECCLNTSTVVSVVQDQEMREEKGTVECVMLCARDALAKLRRQIEKWKKRPRSPSPESKPFTLAGRTLFTFLVRTKIVVDLLIGDANTDLRFDEESIFKEELIGQHKY
jgi:hypothetical protein